MIWLYTQFLAELEVTNNISAVKETDQSPLMEYEYLINVVLGD